jgi:hypothetical protein
MYKALTTLTIFLLLLSTKLYSNQIDDLKTDQDVYEFAKRIYPQFTEYDHAKFAIRPTDSIAKELYCEGIFKSWDIKNWEKADLNNDGLTDLVFIAFWGRYLACAAIDEGNNSFKMINLSNNHRKQCDLVKPIKIGNDNYLKMHRIMSIPDLAHMQNMQYIDSVITDTLVYKFKHLIEFSKKNYRAHNIEPIEMETQGCEGSCPVFTLKLFKSGKADFNGNRYTPHIGQSSRRLPKKFFKNISDIATYIDFKNLKSLYVVDWFDDRTVVFTISYTDGSQKVIRDYGMSGTFGLIALFDNFTEIVNNWN